MEQINLSNKQLAHINRDMYMQPIIKQTAHILGLIFFSSLILAVNPAMANSDKEMQDKLLRQREMLQQGDHSAHMSEANKGPDFKGVYYGYFPCKEEDCNGIKVTLSLKRNNNYLLVTQPAKTSTREFYEKGKFNWNDAKRIVELTPKDKATKGQYQIIDDGTIVQLNPDGSPMAGDHDDYTLRRGDTTKSREMHIH